MIEVLKIDDWIKEYNIVEDEEYEMIPFTEAYIIDDLCHLIINYFTDDEKLNQEYVIVFDCAIKEMKEYVFKNYKYVDGELIKNDILQVP